MLVILNAGKECHSKLISNGNLVQFPTSSNKSGSMDEYLIAGVLIGATGICWWQSNVTQIIKY